MDDFESDTQSLLEFINTKCNDIEENDSKKIIFMYAKCIHISLVNIYKEQNNTYYSIEAANLISNIFKIIYAYSLNLKLSLFICERSILLFNEYLNISKNYSSDKVNILDVKQFIINKSIGPITYKKNNNKLKYFSRLLDLIRSFIFKIFIKKINNDNEGTYTVSEYLEIILNIIINSITNMYVLGYINYTENLLNDILNSDMDNIPKSVNIFKIKIELFLYCYNKLNFSYVKCKESVSAVLNRYDYLINNDNLNIFIDSIEDITEKKYYIKLINYLDKL